MSLSLIESDAFTLGADETSRNCCLTQSIQLSKIVERLRLVSLRALGRLSYPARYPARLEHLCSRFRPRSIRPETQPQAACAASFQFRSRGGGAERDRTVDPLLAKQVLSQLSYSPYIQGPRGRPLRPSCSAHARLRSLRNSPMPYST